jgi:NAD(P)-dependent dehydrogenase (short-subunit alcohol dehydrogenase family)
MIDRAVIFGASSGVGRATAAALSRRGARVWGVSRTLPSPLPGVTDVTGDATDPTVVARVLGEADPDLIVVAVGTRPRMAPIDEYDWESFSAVWNGDVRAAFHVGQLALRRPLRAGSHVVIVSSGAGLHGSPLSGGYAGSKRTQMFLADYLQKRADARKLGIRYTAVVPNQLLAGSEIGKTAAASYGAAAGMSPEKFMERFAAPLDADGVAAAILRIADGDAPAGTILQVTGAKGLEPL